MIIECINCNKKFNVDQKLIPENGRIIQCGSCNHKWHYKIRNLSLHQHDLDEEDNKQVVKLEGIKSEIFKPIVTNDEKKIFNKIDYINDFNDETITEHENKTRTFSLNNFFSYLVIFIISIMALLIFIDTLKSPLIDMFPSLEIVLFNFFETLKDMRLFIIDLT